MNKMEKKGKSDNRMTLNEVNFYMFATKYYDNPNCLSPEEFLEDLNRIKYLKKLLYAYKKKKVLRERLIINHLVVLYNVFEHNACTKMLLFKLPEYHDCLIPFLIYLGYMREIEVILDKLYVIQTVNMPMDEGVKAALKKMDEDRFK
jgi:hypothetical protein